MDSNDGSKVGSIWVEIPQAEPAADGAHAHYLPKIEQSAMVVHESSARANSTNVQTINIALEVHN